VTDLYTPAARSTRALAAAGPSGEPYGGARELAAWKQRMFKAWPGVRVEHVEAEAAAGDELRLGSRLNVRATVALGTVPAGDVTVELVCGRAGEDDEIVEAAHVALSPQDGPEPADGGTVRYAGSVELERPGPFGYTVRVLPRHPLLTVPAEMGLVAMPDAPVGMLNGDLR
jgi:starch phosphorylase